MQLYNPPPPTQPLATRTDSLNPLPFNARHSSKGQHLSRPQDPHLCYVPNIQLSQPFPFPGLHKPKHFHTSVDVCRLLGGVTGPLPVQIFSGKTIAAVNDGSYSQLGTKHRRGKITTHPRLPSIGGDDHKCTTGMKQELSSCAASRWRRTR